VNLGLATLMAWCLGASLMVVPAGSAHASENEVKPVYYVPKVPQDMNDLDFYLMTGGPGYEVNDRFGHTAIRVVNRAEGTDVAFNWGKFSFDDPGFLWKFFRGQLDYSMGVRTFERDVALYGEMDRRVVMDHLNLTSQQKQRLISKIAWNAVPEHRRFSYQYWYKNCATIPRDYLNDVLGNQIYQRFATQPANRVFRDYVRRNLTYSPFIVPLLDVLMNSNIDRPISAWEDMFLPHNLRRWLLTMPALDDHGQPVKNQKLLSDERVLLDHPEVFKPKFNDFLALSLPVTLGLIFAVSVLVLRPRRESVAYRAIGVATFWWALVSGLLGTTLLLNWFFSGHPDGWHNANLMLFWPTDWLFVAAGWHMMRSGNPMVASGLVRRYGRLYAWGHLLSLVGLCGLVGAGIITQNVWQVLTWFGGATMAVMSVLLLTSLPVASALTRELPSGQVPLKSRKTMA